MNFEEEYPSLKEKRGGIIVGGKFVFDDRCKCWYNFQDIQENCLDKAKVKELLQELDKSNGYDDDAGFGYASAIDDLRKRLGL